MEEGLGRQSLGPVESGGLGAKVERLGGAQCALPALALTSYPVGLLSCVDGALRVPISAKVATVLRSVGARAQDGSSLFLDPSLGSGLFA